MTERPYWWPVKIDENYIGELRKNYSEFEEASDVQILHHFCEGRAIGGYSTTWDHLGDAYDDYAGLADAFLALVSRLKLTPSDFD